MNLGGFKQGYSLCGASLLGSGMELLLQKPAHLIWTPAQKSEKVNA